jgi:hypothetical protein
MCQECKKKCHINCAYENDGDKINCCAMDKVTHFCKKCSHFWDKHINYRAVKEEIEEVEEVKTNEDMLREYHIVCSEINA